MRAGTPAVLLIDPPVSSYANPLKIVGAVVWVLTATVLAISSGAEKMSLTLTH